MPVRKDSEADGEAKYTINNGDLIALNQIRDRYGLRDSDNVLTFAIGVLKQAGGRPVMIQNEQGAYTSLLPSDELRRDDKSENVG